MNPHERGRQAETIVADYVGKRGMAVLERNLRVGRLEVDIVARDGDTIVIIEVRTRGAGAWQNALHSVGRVKRDRLRQAARVLWSRRFAKQRSLRGVRFDVAAVRLDLPEPTIDYVRAAFV